MLSAFALSAMLTALIAGIAGAWSPCGFSMVDTIGTALGDPRRSSTYLACATFTLGAVLGGALTFGGLASVGQLAGHQAVGVREALGAVVALAAALADWRGLAIAPQIRRQVPERWRWTLPLPLACALYGILLGLGFTTFVLAFAVWALAGISFAVGSPLTGLAIGCAFGVGRALPVLWMAPGPRRGPNTRALDDMAAEPRLWLGLRRLDALGLCLCALFLSGAGAANAAEPPSATDPAASGEAVAWQQLGGPGVLRLASSAPPIVLPGSYPALSDSSIAWYANGQITLADRVSRTMKAVFAAARVSALALSDEWVVYRAASDSGDSERLMAISLLSPTPAPRLVLSKPVGVIGRPVLDGSTLVVALDTARSAALRSIDLASGAHRLLRFAGANAALLNPALLGGRLLYERVDRCSQQLLIGSLVGKQHDRVLLRVPSTVFRDTGYEPSYEHAYNMGSICSNRRAGRGGTIRLGATALAPASAYVTEIPSNTTGTHIVGVSRR